MILALLAVVACGDGGTDADGSGAEAAGGGASTGSMSTSGPGGTTTGTATGTSASSTGSGQGGAPPSVESWFSTDFNDLNANGPEVYDFEGKHDENLNNMEGNPFWVHTHTEDQGWLGSPAPHVTVLGCPEGSGCDTATHQWHVGWVTPDMGGTHALGESVFIRFRIKFDPGTEFHTDQLGAKFILFGLTTADENEPNSRWIIHLEPAKKFQGCTLGFEYYADMGWYPPEWTWYEASDWGFNDFAQAPALNQDASFESNINIGWSCNPGVLVTRSDHATPVPKPQNRGEAAVDGWTHLQFEAIPNPANQTTFRSWANNNNQAMPSSERTEMPDALGVDGWTGGVNVGGYWGIGDHPDIGFIIDDFEIGSVFDPNWAQ